MTLQRLRHTRRRVRPVACAVLVALLWTGAAPAAGTPAVAEASGRGSARAATGFSSGFNTHHNGWTVLSGSWEHAPGVFHTEGLPGERSSIIRTGAYGDFTYEARIKRLGCTVCANTLVVRSRPDAPSVNDFAPAFFFSYSNEEPGAQGMFSVHKILADGSWVTLKTWTYTPAVVKEGWNVLKVVATGNTFRFYINGTKVWQGTKPGPASGRVGLSMYSQDGIGDDFRIDWAQLTVATAGTAGFPSSAPQAGVEVLGGSPFRSPGG